MNFTIYIDKTCKIITIIFSIITFGLLSMTFIYKSTPWIVYVVIVFILCIYTVAFLVKPTKYIIDNGKLIIQSIILRKEYNLSEIESVKFLCKNDLNKAFRVFGIAGGFSYRGDFLIKNWGKVTSYSKGFKNNMVLIQLKSGKNILLSPLDEELFNQSLTKAEKESSSD
ncbi:MAG TPA: PH domain-containing protein [Hanamia sp.]|nr:PH domain-containing protein [Hanamia sp.]